MIEEGDQNGSLRAEATQVANNVKNEEKLTSVRYQTVDSLS